MKPLPARSGPHPSRFAISEYLAGEGTAAEREVLEAHTRACPDCAAVLRSAVEARDAFLSRNPRPRAADAPRAIRPPARPGLLDRLRDLWGSPAGKPAFAFAALLILAVVAIRPTFRTAPPDLSAKGAARFVLFVNGRPAAGDSVACRAGDTLQLGIVAEKPVHYAILYRDDEGPLQTYMDEGNGRPVGAPGGENLPHSLVLTAGWARERLYCVWSPEPFDAGAARARAEGGQAGEAGKAGEAGGLGLRSFLLLNSP